MVEATLHGDRKVYSVSAFNRGIADLAPPPAGRLGRGRGHRAAPQRRLGDRLLHAQGSGRRAPACGVTMQRRRFDALELGARRRASACTSHGRRRALRGARASSASAPTTIERSGSATISRRSSGSSGRSPPRACSRPSASGRCRGSRARSASLTGADAAARGDVVRDHGRGSRPRTSSSRRRACRAPGRPRAIVAALAALAAHAGVDVVIVARGGGSFEDLLPFSDERVVRAFAACPVPVVSAVGHEQDTPLCDLAADVRASTPTAAARLVVPDLDELRAALERLARSASTRSVARALEQRPRAARARPASACGPRRAPARAAARVARPRRGPAAGALAEGDARARLRDRPLRRRRRARARRRVAPGTSLEIELARAGSARASRRCGREREPDEARSFEELQRELDEIVGGSSAATSRVDEAIALWQRGEELYRACAALLEAAERRIEELRLAEVR